MYIYLRPLNNAVIIQYKPKSIHMNKPTIGRILILTISEQAAAEINRRRTTSNSIAERVKSDTWPIGAQAHIGNEVTPGAKVPMIVTAVWGEACVNGQALLDGNDTLWVTSATEGDQPGQWQWPTRD